MERSLAFPADIASIAPSSFKDAQRLVSLVPARANAIELRLDLAPVRISPRALLELDGRCVIITYRTTREGGKFDGSREEYRRSIRSAYDAGAVVDVELESGLLSDPGFLSDRRRVIGSRHGSVAGPDAALSRFAEEPVAAVKLVLPEPDRVAESVACVAAVARWKGPRPVSCFALGRRGMLSRILGPHLGASLRYGSVEAVTGDGQLPLAELLETYRIADPAPVEKLFAVYGRDVSHSLSPKIHNTLFSRRKLPFLYLPVSSSRCDDRAAGPLAGDLAALDSIAQNLSGVSVTNPFKEDFPGTSRPDGAAAAIGAANTLVRRGPGRLELSAHNTDADAIRDIFGRLDLGGREVLILGAGGAARAAAHAARGAGCPVTLAGRDPQRVRVVAERFGARAASLGDLPSENPGVLINATPLGATDGDAFPFPEVLLKKRPAVVDFAYRRSGRTPLVEVARRRGCAVADGREILARQAAGQARLFGLSDATDEEVRDILGEA